MSTEPGPLGEVLAREIESALGPRAVPSSITGDATRYQGSVVDHRFGKSEPYTLGVEEEYMLLDPGTLDLVQHIDTVLAAVAGARARDADHERADAVGARDRDPRLPNGRRRDARAPDAARLRLHDRARPRAPCRLGGHPSVQPVRGASGSPRRIATTRSIDQLQYVARRELIFGMHIHVAIDDPDKAIQVVNGAPARARAAARAVGQLALLARPADGPGLEPADGVLGLPALRPAAAVPRLRGLRAGRRPARAHGLHRGLHPHLVGHQTPPQVGDDRDPDLRRGHARRGRRRDRGVPARRS